MAINKERLEELINEGATIYSLDKQVKYSIPIFLKDGENVVVNDNELVNSVRVIDKIENLYETQKEAEWHLKYHATRTEELNLPMFDEKQDITYWFFDAKGFEILLVCVNGEVGVLRYDNKALDKELFCEPATEENYIKACDLCLKLFKVEEE